jgi:hypothetical protein
MAIHIAGSEDALASERITTDVIMVNLFPYMAIRYQLDDVPTTDAGSTHSGVGSVEKVLTGRHEPPRG